jgi:hypothetical protein
MQPVPITKRLRKAQGESSATLYLLHQHGAVELYARQRVGRPLDYAVVRRSRFAHGATPTEALADLRAQLQQAITESQRPLTWATGLELGFTPACLHAFCQANHLDPASTITPAELRRTATQHLAANWPHYARGLRRLGIHLKPPTS